MPVRSSSDRNLSTGERRDPSASTTSHTSPAAPRPLASSTSLSSSLRLRLPPPGAHSALIAPPVRRNRGEGVESGAREEIREVDELHPVPEIRFVGSETLEHLVVGHPPERDRHLDALRLGDDPRIQGLDDGDDVVFVDEGHLDVQLRELEPAVGAGRLVAEASHDLVVPVLATHHQELFQLLRRLRQREEGARPHPHRHEEVTRALGRGSAEHRRLDLDEPQRIEMLVHQTRHLVTQPQVRGHLGAA